MTKRILSYLAAFLCGWVAICLTVATVVGDTSLVQLHSLTRKLKEYRANPDRYDLVFVGDSRTYCSYQPEYLDPLLGSRSVNLAIWANWIPTQYLFNKDLIPAIPAGTTVVWSLGRGNFSRNALNAQYPLTVGDVAHFLELGLSPKDTLTCWMTHHPLFRFPMKRKPAYDRMEHLRQRALLVLGPETSGQAKAPPLLFPPDTELHVADREVLMDQGRPTSVAYRTAEGAYCRYELDHAFFRNKQKASALTPQQIASFKPAEPLPGMERLFDESLRAFHQAGIHLILAVVEDSPYTYGAPAIQAAWREQLVRLLRRHAAPYGFPVLALSYSRLTDADYFDYNHLNYQGIRKFTPMFVQKIRPYWRQGK